MTTDQYTSWPNGILKYSNVRLSWVHFRSAEPHLYKSTRKPCAQSEYSDQHGHMLCALGLRCVFNARRDAKTQYFLIHKKRADPYQNGRIPTHGEWMLFLKRCDKNEWPGPIIFYRNPFLLKVVPKYSAVRYLFDDTHKIWTRSAYMPLQYQVQKIWL